MGGLFSFGSDEPEETKGPVVKKPQIDKVDQVKFKLKKARDTIKRFLNSKNNDLAQIEQKIAEKVPAFKQTGNKKQLIPLLKAKKDLLSMIDAGGDRLKLVNAKLDQVQMQKINAETIDVLEESNRYMQEIQQQLQKKDWRNVLEEAQQKYNIQWPDQQAEENDPAFQQMWRQLGGEKIAAKSKPSQVTDNKIVQPQFVQIVQPQFVQHQIHRTNKEAQYA